MRVILVIFMCVMPLFADYKIRDTQDSTTQSPIETNAESKKRQDSNQNAESTLQKRPETNQNAESTTKKRTDSKKSIETPAKKRSTTKQNAESSENQQAKQPTTNQSTKKTTKDTIPTKNTKSTQPKPTPNEATKKLGYRNITISNINKQTTKGIDFFIGAHFGIDIVNMEHITEDANASKKRQKSTSGSASFGLKGGILSEEEWVGGRFYGEFSYLKIPKFNVINIGLDLDLLFNYYKSEKWRIGGFLGIGGGMNAAMIADKELKNAGKKTLIAIGWANIGLVRFVYGSHSAEFNVRVAFVTPTIYSLKDKDTAITTTYKASSNTLLFSYAFQF